MPKTTLTFAGGADMVTGSNFLLTDAESDISMLVDCGLFQGCEECNAKNREAFPYNPASVDILFVTHAHIDHIGRIPKLAGDGFSGTIYSTPATKDIAAEMLRDSLNVMTFHAKKEGAPEPFFDEKDIEKALRMWETREYHEPIHVQGGYTATFHDAGHILGSAMVRITRGERNIVLTGDLGNSPSPIIADTETLGTTHYMVMESVYGDRNHEEKNQRTNLLKETVRETIARGGTLVMPVFSLERTQMMLYELNNLIEDGHVPSVPVFLDSPLAIAVTDIYRKYQKHYNEEVKKEIAEGDDIFSFPKLSFTESRDESMDINKVPGPKIVLAGSGMSGGGRVLHHERRYLSDPKNTLLLVGYQVPGTLGRALQDGAKEVTIFGDTVQVKAHIAHITGYSAHKDSDHLLEFAADAKDTLEEVFVAMGELKAASFLAQRLRDFYGINARVPKAGEEAVLDL